MKLKQLNKTISDPCGNPRIMSVDMKQLASLPPREFEAAIHLAIDEVMALGERQPLEALRAMTDLASKLNGEILKCVAPAAVYLSQHTADNALGLTVTAEPNPPPILNRDRQRLLGVFQQTTEAAIKLGLAKVKIDDEVRRRAEG